MSKNECDPLDPQDKTSLDFDCGFSFFLFPLHYSHICLNAGLHNQEQIMLSPLGMSLSGGRGLFYSGNTMKQSSFGSKMSNKNNISYYLNSPKQCFDDIIQLGSTSQIGLDLPAETNSLKLSIF